MEAQTTDIKRTPQRLLNGSRHGKGKNGTKMHAFSSTSKVAVKYQNGENSSKEELSCAERMNNRSNQYNEGGNMFRNFVGMEVVRQGADPTLVSWSGQQQLLENEDVGRKKNFEEETGYKPKNKKYQKLDRILCSYIKDCKAGRCTRNENFSKCVDAIEKTWSPYEEI